MTLYLVRHGEAHSEESDPGRSLTDQGKAAVEEMAKLTESFKIQVSQIVHSGKTRARQTAEIFSGYLKPSGGVKEISGIKPHDSVATIAAKLDPEQNIMLVGHLPFLERLVSYLITGSPDNSIITFQAGGIVALDKSDENRFWHIKWAVMPNMR